MLQTRLSFVLARPIMLQPLLAIDGKPISATVRRTCGCGSRWVSSSMSGPNGLAAAFGLQNSSNSMVRLCATIRLGKRATAPVALVWLWLTDQKVSSSITDRLSAPPTRPSMLLSFAMESSSTSLGRLMDSTPANVPSNCFARS